MRDKVLDIIKNHKKQAIVCVAAMLALMLVIVIGIFVLNGVGKKRLQATKKYNEAVAEYNLVVDEFNKSIVNCMIDNIEGFYIPEKLNTVREQEKDIKKSFEQGNTIKKIEADIVTINEMTKVLEANIQVIEQIKEPTQQWVVDRLSNVEGINEIGSVTLETDVNAMLGKEGGYTSCIYFGLDSIDASLVRGDDIVAKGTDAGGAIEVFANVADAEARCKYLEEYTGTLLYSGSYAIVGTMVIRTSYKLTDEEQLELTDRITMEFTKIY